MSEYTASGLALAKRTSSTIRTASTKPMRCPICKRGRVIDVSSRIAGSVQLLGDPNAADHADLFSKCPK